MANSFLALLPDSDTAAALLARQRDIRSWGLEGRLVASADLHLTVVYMGHHSEDHCRRRARSLHDVAGACGPFALPMAGLGAIVRKQQVKAIYAAIGDPNGVLADLQYDSQDALGISSRAGDEREPHINLLRPEVVPRLSDLFAAYADEVPVTAYFDRLALLRTDPSHGGRYRAVQEWNL